MGNISLILKYDDETRQTAEVYVEGKLQGNTARFLLDTGCAKTTLTRNHLTQDLTSLGKEDSSGTFAKAEYDLVELSSIAVGPMSRENWTVRRARQGGTDRHLFGMDVMSDYCLLFAFDEAIVSIVSDSDGRPDSVDQTLVMERGLIPYIDCEVHGISSTAVWDSGAGITLVDSSFVDEHPEMFVPMGSEMGTDSTNTRQETPIFMMSGLVVAGRPFGPVKVAAVPLSNQKKPTEAPLRFVLGFSVLRQAHWLFDFPRRKWMITKMLSL